jgi:hypothetical protein
MKDRYLYMAILPELFRYRRQYFHYILLVLGTGWYIVRFRPGEKLKVISDSRDLGGDGT